MSLPKINIPLPCGFIYQHLPDRQIACNHRCIIQTRCEYHGGFVDHFSWTDTRVSRIELSLWKMMSSIMLSPEHPQNDMWSKVLGKTQILPEELIQEWWWNVNHIVMKFFILFWDHISSFTETCLAFVSLLFWNQQRFSILFWQNILIKL